MSFDGWIECGEHQPPEGMGFDVRRDDGGVFLAEQCQLERIWDCRVELGHHWRPSAEQGWQRNDGTEPDCERVDLVLAEGEHIFGADGQDWRWMLSGLSRDIAYWRPHQEPASTPEPETAESAKPRIYIAGPMRGIPYFNFPAFDKAKAELEADWDVLSPADLDRDVGFDPETLPADTDWHDLDSLDFCIDHAIDRDVEAIKKCSAIYMLEGWENSRGARAEKAIAEWKGLPVMYQKPATEESILEEAARITQGDRQASYGPPDQDFQRTAAMWGVLFTPRIVNGKLELKSSDVAAGMIALKLSRQVHQEKRDNWVDTAGYAYCGSRCQ